MGVCVCVCGGGGGSVMGKGWGCVMQVTHSAILSGILLSLNFSCSLEIGWTVLTWRSLVAQIYRQEKFMYVPTTLCTRSNQLAAEIY